METWDQGGAACMEPVAPVYQQALQAYAHARGLDPTLIEGTGHQLLRNEGDVPLQWVHRDYTVTNFPTVEDCVAADRTQKDRIA